MKEAHDHAAAAAPPLCGYHATGNDAWTLLSHSLGAMMGRLLSIAVACLAASAIAGTDSPASSTKDSPFERVVWKESHPPDVSLLYLVLTLPQDQTSRIDALCQLVMETAPDALRVADRYRPMEFNVVYQVRVLPGIRTVYYTGFTIEQLQQAVKLPRDKAIAGIALHTWGVGILGPAE